MVKNGLNINIRNEIYGNGLRSKGKCVNQAIYQ